MQAAKTELKIICSCVRIHLFVLNTLRQILKIIESIDKPLASSSEPRHATLLFPKEIQGKLVKLRL